MAKNTWVNSKKTSATGKGSSDGRTAGNTKVSGLAVNSTASAYTETERERRRKDSGSMAAEFSGFLEKLF
jgi:hypothetical protein